MISSKVKGMADNMATDEIEDCLLVAYTQKLGKEDATYYARPHRCCAQDKVNH